MAETQPSGEVKEIFSLVEWGAEVMEDLQFEKLGQKPKEGPGYSFIEGRIEEELDGKMRQRYFQIRHYLPKDKTPEKWELYTTVPTSRRFAETFTIAGNRDKYTHWKEPQAIMIEKWMAPTHPLSEVHASLNRFADLAQKIRTSAKFS